MLVIGLDLSNSTGYGVIQDGKLLAYGKITTQGVITDHSLEEYNLIRNARCIASRICSFLATKKPDLIVIEQTNLGRARGTQKGLEFIHFAVLDMLENIRLDDKVVYADTSAWRKSLNIKLSKEQRKHNKKNSENKRKAKSTGKKFAPKKGEGKITWKHLSVMWANEKFGLEFKLVDNDIADAIALAQYGYARFNLLEEQSSNINEVDLNIFK